jgi:hypothetical protein
LPLLLAAFAAGVPFCVVYAIGLMFPNKPATIALVLMCRGIVWVRFAREHVQQFLKRITAKRTGLASRFRSASPPAFVAKSILGNLFLMLY